MAAPKTRIPRRARRKSPAQGADVGERANNALTNLIAYALTLDIEYHRLDDRLAELAATNSTADELRATVRERDEIGAQRQAYRRSVAALREQAGLEPGGLL